MTFAGNIREPFLNNSRLNFTEGILLLPVRFFELRMLKQMGRVITLSVFRNITGLISVQTKY